jgi:hypothetical protein
VTCTPGSGDGAGPPTTLPVAASKRLPWHGQLMVPLPTELTWQPWCVQTAENACTCEPVRVMTTAGLSMITPPPSGMSASFASGWPDAFGVSP